MIIAFRGRRGSGKTLGMTYRLELRKKKGFKIITNYGAKCTDETLDAERLVKMEEDLQDVAIGVDEIHILVDARRSSSSRNLMITYFITQTRKRNVVFMYTCQTWGSVDKRIRENTDYLVDCQRISKNEFYYAVYDTFDGTLAAEYILNGTKIYSRFDTKKAITDFFIPKKGK